MADWPEVLSQLGAHDSLASIGPAGVISEFGAASAAWPSANLAIFTPVRVLRTCTVYKMAFGCGATAGGNADVGIYTWGGTRLVSSGSTARSASSEVIADVTDTTLHPGRYWLAMSVDGTSNIVAFGAGGNAGLGKLLGLRQMATAFALPSTATFATSAQSLLPAVCAYLRSD